MEPAWKSPRCHYVRPNGIRCGSPALREKPYCFFHDRSADRSFGYRVPPLEDANAVQFAIQEIVRALLEKAMDYKTAGLLLYALQIASANLRHVTFSCRTSEMVTEYPVPAPPTQEAA